MTKLTIMLPGRDISLEGRDSNETVIDDLPSRGLITRTRDKPDSSLSYRVERTKSSSVIRERPSAPASFPLSLLRFVIIDQGKVGRPLIYSMVYYIRLRNDPHEQWAFRVPTLCHKCSDHAEWTVDHLTFTFATSF